MIDAIPQIISDIFDTENGFLSANNIGKLVEGAVKVVEALVVNTPKIIASLIAEIPNIIVNIIKAFGSILSDFFDLGSEAGNKFAEGILNSMLDSPIITAIMDLGAPGAAASLYQLEGYRDQQSGKQFWKNLSYETHKKRGSDAKGVKGRYAMAQGGVVKKPTEILAGDDGAEAIMPLEKNTGWIAKLANRLATLGALDIAGGVYGSAARSQKTINFTQNNYSPEPIDRLTIYRNTRNTLNLMESGGY